MIGKQQIRDVADAATLGDQRQTKLRVANFPDACESVPQTIPVVARARVLKPGGEQRQTAKMGLRIRVDGIEVGMGTTDHQSARLAKAGLQGEVARHGVPEGAEAEFPAILTDAVHDFPARCDGELEARERIAMTELEHEVAAVRVVHRARHRE